MIIGLDIKVKQLFHVMTAFKTDIYLTLITSEFTRFDSPMVQGLRCLMLHVNHCLWVMSSPRGFHAGSDSQAEAVGSTLGPGLLAGRPPWQHSALHLPSRQSYPKVAKPLPKM